MILRDKQDYTVLHLFSGSGGGALGFKRAGFRSLGSTERPNFGTNYTDALADQEGASRQVTRWDAGGGRVLEIITTAQTSRRTLVVGWFAAGVLGAGVLALLRLLGLPV